MIEVKEMNDNIIKVILPNTLQDQDFTQITVIAGNLIRKYSKIKILVDASNFSGWRNIKSIEKHISFVKGHQISVERIAFIAGHKWQHWLAAVIRLFVHPEIKIFDKDQMSLAEEWLAS